MSNPIRQNVRSWCEGVGRKSRDGSYHELDTGTRSHHYQGTSGYTRISEHHFY